MYTFGGNLSIEEFRKEFSEDPPDFPVVFYSSKNRVLLANIRTPQKV